MLDLKGFNVDILKTRDIVGVVGVIIVGAVEVGMDSARFAKVVRR